MSKSIPPTLTIEEAVSLLIGLDYIPSGLTALDMTAAFLEDSEVDMENNPKSSIRSARHDVCLARHQLATSLLNALNLEAENKDSEYLDRSEDISPSPRLTTESLNHWAQDRFGITLWAPSAPSVKTDSELTNATWRDVTIKIYKGYQIAFRVGQSSIRRSSFSEIKLLGKKKLEPNACGHLLLDFAERKRYPKSTSATAASRTMMSKLRDCLTMLVPISGDPFTPYNIDDGWRPNFKLIDERRNADERAKRGAIHIAREPEAPDFKDEDDETGQWIREREYR